MRPPETLPPLLIHVLILLVLLPSWGCAGSGPEPADQPSVILVSLDTLRADRLSIYGHHLRSTPHLDRLAGRGLVFEQVATVSENTLVSHTSLVTGLYAVAHATTHIGGGRALAQSYRTMAEDYSAAGYQTAAFVGNSTWLSRRYGFDQGFQRFEENLGGADSVLKNAGAWFAARDRSKPFFALIHLFDIHSDFQDRPYQAPMPYEGWLASSADGPGRAWRMHETGGSRFLQSVNNGEMMITAGDVEDLRRQYDEGVAATDFQLWQFLCSLNCLEDSYLVITADHGEGFQEHDRLLHTTFFDTVIRIPLIIVPPSDLRSDLGVPRRLAEQVNIVDLRPTLAALTGLPAPEICQGADLTPWLRGAGTACPSNPGIIRRKALRHEGFKLIRAPRGPQLFDLQSDPAEQVDLAGLPEMKDRLDRMMETLVEQVRRDAAIRDAQQGGRNGPLPPADPDDLEALRQLGYVQ